MKDVAQAALGAGRTGIFAITALFASLAVLESAVEASAETLRLGHSQKEDSAYHAAAEFMAEEVAKLDGDLEIKIFPSGQLGGEVPMMESTAAGVQDLTIAAAAWASTLIEPLGFFSVSYLFDGEEHYRKVLNDPKFNEMVAETISGADAGLVHIATLAAGARNLYTKEPVEDISDVQGMKLRVMGSPIESKVWSAIGASPFSVPFGDIYSALQTGLAEGAENSGAPYSTFKHYEVAPYYTLTGHQWLIAFMFMSEKKWSSLSKEQQAAVREIGARATNVSLDYVIAGDKAFLDDLVENHGVTVSEIDTTPFQERVAPLQDEVAADLKMQPMLERIRALK